MERWSDSPTRQYFSGAVYCEHRQPCDFTTLIKFHKAIGEEGAKELLTQIVNAALQTKLMSPKHRETIIVDTTVQPKAVAHPTDARRLELGTAIEAKMTVLSEAIKAACISKGKTHTPYEFGTKVSIAASLHGNLVVGAPAFGGRSAPWGAEFSSLLPENAYSMDDESKKPGELLLRLSRLPQAWAKEAAEQFDTNHWILCREHLKRSLAALGPPKKPAEMAILSG